VSPPSRLFVVRVAALQALLNVLFFGICRNSFAKDALLHRYFCEASSIFSCLGIFFSVFHFVFGVALWFSRSRLAQLCGTLSPSPCACRSSGASWAGAGHSRIAFLHGMARPPPPVFDAT